MLKQYSSVQLFFVRNASLVTKIFNFELESKLDLHFDVKFDGECVVDGPEANFEIWP